MERVRRIHLFEIVIYSTILFTLFSFPFFTNIYTERGWDGVLLDWLRITPFLLVFLVNNFLLVPKLLFKEKYTGYLLACIGLIVVSVILNDFVFDTIRSYNSPLNDFPRHEFKHGGGPPHGIRHGGPPPGFFNIGQIMISFLLIGFNTGVKIFIRYTETQMQQSEKEKQHLFTELAFLKYQISPHFFMNTLNNIHSLVDIDGERAKDAIVKLSKMMRYLLYESEPEKVSLKKEIEFMESYIELMRLRYDENEFNISFIYPQQTDNIKVPAFLYLSFIENAFKHGILSTGKSFVRLNFSIRQNNCLSFSMENSIGSYKESIKEASGIGIENIKKRLNILYKENYLLEIKEEDAIFKVLLDIPV